jgi:hypothetical protein
MPSPVRRAPFLPKIFEHTSTFFCHRWNTRIKSQSLRTDDNQGRIASKKEPLEADAGRRLGISLPAAGERGS